MRFRSAAWFGFALSGALTVIAYALPWVHVALPDEASRATGLLDDLGVGNVVLEFNHGEQAHRLDLSLLKQFPLTLRGYEIPIFMRRTEVQGTADLAQWYGVRDVSLIVGRSQWLWAVPVVACLSLALGWLLRPFAWQRTLIALALLGLGTVVGLRAYAFYLDRPVFLSLLYGVWVCCACVCAMGLTLLATAIAQLVDIKSGVSL